MIHQSTRKRVCDKLLESLGNADRGSRELDIIISFVLGDASSQAGKMIQLLVEEGYPWRVVSELLDEGIPPYTTSLDAAMPGENIVLTLYSPKRTRWAAVHKTPSDEQMLVWAASECLARRRAALRAMRATLLQRAATARPATRDATRDAPGAEAPRQAESAHGWSRPHESGEPMEQASEEGEEEWKILF
jgi:hypothetical protein